MRRRRYSMGGRIYPMVWTIIVLVAAILLMRFTALYLFDDVGQASNSIGDKILEKFCATVIDSGSSLVSYSKNDKVEGGFLGAKQMASAYAIREHTINDIREALPMQETTFASNQEDIIYFYDVTEGHLSKEYILTNGALFPDDKNNNLNFVVASNQSLPIGFLDGELFYEESDEKNTVLSDLSSSEVMNTKQGVEYTLEQMKDINFLVRNFYIVESSTRVTDHLFDAEKLLGKDMTIKQKNEKPQILIYHTHSQEDYIDSRPGVPEDTVVGVGTFLKNILEEQYGYNVIQDKTQYDIKNGKLDRNLAYKYALAGIEKILKENPTIEVVIDLHRDALKKRSTMIDGKEVAQVMLLNGLSRDQNGPLAGLDNPNLQENLAFSLQLQLKSQDKYPGLFYKNYLKPLRFNLHVRPKAILMELGTEENTLQSARNAMVPFAEILDDVLQGK